MKLKQLASLPFASLALLGLSMGSTQATVTWVGGATGAWEVPANWLSDDDPPVNRLPINSEWIRPTAVATITYSAASGTTNLPGSTLWQDTGASHATHIQTGGSLTLGSVYLAQDKTDTLAPSYTISGGSLTASRLFMSWNGLGTTASNFLQSGGTVTIGNDVSMALKSSTQRAVYELQDGTFTVNGNVLMGNGSANSVTEITQSSGTATVGGYLSLGSHAGTTGSSIYNLDGGTLTMEAAVDPFLFTQPGAPVYFDFDGGTLNLKGTWDFNTLTGIANSDFRVAGVAATAGDLAFDPVTIGSDAYTQITVIPEPSSAGLLGLAGLALAARRRR